MKKDHSHTTTETTTQFSFDSFEIGIIGKHTVIIVLDQVAEN